MSVKEGRLYSCSPFFLLLKSGLKGEIEQVPPQEEELQQSVVVPVFMCTNDSSIYCAVLVFSEYGSSCTVVSEGRVTHLDGIRCQ